MSIDFTQNYDAPIVTSSHTPLDEGELSLNQLDGERMKIGRLGRPELEVRHLEGRPAAFELRLHRILSVEDKRRVEIALLEVHGLDLDGAGRVVARPHEQLAVVE